ncbi:haloacid dehalogenase-like hydrolase [Aspergillus bombycis]|uniref:Haloacid dehalogenase-like hydrolase n=1 Tax=Aspergillus bombycis TaxID=109264 RepID=A0A1F7ZQ23_9EURO|nr:haloacid dehalogenase-like hydrolase [Aspergillus bombycis]OGM41208.1 haloacid dehalogenase-like hydrolase [Aspergillus bombycis]
MPPKPRTLLLTLDAFETLFHPRPSVPEQYASAAHRFGLPQTAITAERVLSAFKPVFKAQSQARPNYGRDDVIRGHYGGPRQWWAEIIQGTFSRVLAEQSNNNTTTNSNSDNNNNSQGQLDLPEGLVGYLLDRFASKEGYALYDDVEPFFSRIRAVKEQGALLGPFDRVLVGVVSNSDDRVPAVLKSLGLRVGDCRADEGVDSMRLSGFEERSSSGVEGSDTNDGVKDIDLVITSYEAGVEKPSPRIFEVAMRQAKALARADVPGDWTCVHVGDDCEKDYRAAVGAGWDGYFLARGDDARSGDDGDNVIRSLMDLIPVLEGYH